MDRINLLAVLLALAVVAGTLFSLFTQGRWIETAYRHVTGAQQAYGVELKPMEQRTADLPAPPKEPVRTPPPKKKPQRRGRSLDQILHNPLGQ